MPTSPSMRQPLRQYLAVDGGAGAHVIALLPTAAPGLRAVATPRHADLLIVAGPISARLAPSIAQLARALPVPAQALLLLPEVSDSEALQQLFPGALTSTLRSGDAGGDILRVVEAIRGLGAPTKALTLGDAHDYEPPLIPMPGANEHEMATELIAFSLGPLQPFTAGPLRLWLICDGEQVLECRVDAGYAARDLAGRMAATDWRAAADLAAQLDPLAPVAGHMAYVRAVEALQGWRAPTQVERAREAALALERALNHLHWVTRFFRLLAAPRLAEQAADLAWRASALAGGTLSAAALAATTPQGDVWAQPPHAAEARQSLAAQVERLARWVRRDRLLGLRTHGIGALPPAWITEVALDSPTAAASAAGANDCHARLLARLTQAAADLRQSVGDAMPPQSGIIQREPVRAAQSEARGGRWEVPAGVAGGEALGPRGRLAVRLTSAGGAGPTRVAWTSRPSARALALLPRLLEGQVVADAEIIVASLDLSMAEADG